MDVNREYQKLTEEDAYHPSLVTWAQSPEAMEKLSRGVWESVAPAPLWEDEGGMGNPASSHVRPPGTRSGEQRTRFSVRVKGKSPVARDCPLTSVCTL